MTEQSPPDSKLRSTLPGPLGKVDDALAAVESIILALGVMLMALNTVANVLSRFIIGESLHFTEEVNRILIVLITFAGIGYAARHGRHIRMSAIFDVFPTNARRYLMSFIAIVTAAIMFYLTYWSIYYIGDVRSSGRVLPTLGIPIWSIYIWVPLGLAVTGIQYALTSVKNLTSDEVYLSTAIKDGYEEHDHDQG